MRLRTDQGQLGRRAGQLGRRAGQLGRTRGRAGQLADIVVLPQNRITFGKLQAHFREYYQRLRAEQKRQDKEAQVRASRGQSCQWCVGVFLAE